MAKSTPIFNSKNLLLGIVIAFVIIPYLTRNDNRQ